MNIRKASEAFTKNLVKIVIYAIFAVVLIVLAMMAYRYGQRVFSASGVEQAPGTDIYLTIPEDSSAKEVGGILESYGEIGDSFIFRLQAFIYELDDMDIVPGDYTFNTSQNAEQIIEMLKTGPETEEQEE